MSRSSHRESVNKNVTNLGELSTKNVQKSSKHNKGKSSRKNDNGAKSQLQDYADNAPTSEQISERLPESELNPEVEQL